MLQFPSLVYINISLKQGIASMLFEALAAENAIVGSNVGGQSELVTEDVGVLVNISIGLLSKAFEAVY